MRGQKKFDGYQLPSTVCVILNLQITTTILHCSRRSCSCLPRKIRRQVLDMPGRLSNPSTIFEGLRAGYFNTSEMHYLVFVRTQALKASDLIHESLNKRRNTLHSDELGFLNIELILQNFNSLGSDST